MSVQVHGWQQPHLKSCRLMSSGLKTDGECNKLVQVVGKDLWQSGWPDTDDWLGVGGRRAVSNFSRQLLSLRGKTVLADRGSAK